MTFTQTWLTEDKLASLTHRERETEVLFFMINFIEMRHSDMVDLGPELNQSSGPR